MVKHIVLWKLQESAEGADAAQNAQKIKTTLEALPGKIEGIVALEVGINFNTADAAYDVALYSEFESRESLNTYQKHPEHVKAAAFVKSVVSARVVADYDI